jgi:hypothetical protein
METITSADGTTTGWQRSGSGPPLLLVHGTTADHTRWSGISPQLDQHFAVHAMDRRGRGASTDDTEGYDILREAELRRLGVVEAGRALTGISCIMRSRSLWLRPSVTGLTGWLTLKWEGCEKSKVALATRSGPQRRPAGEGRGRS